MNKLFFLIILFAQSSFADTFYGPTSIEANEYKELTIYGPAILKEIQVMNLTVNGPANIKDLQAYNIKVNGPLEFKYLTVKNELKLNGPLEGRYTSIKKLAANGPIKLEDFTIEEEALCAGPVSLTNGTLSDLSVDGGEKFVLKDVTLNSLTINKDGKFKVQKLYLKGSVTVNGNISFESGKGVIIIEKPNATSIVGNIEGAVVEK
jgi:hypothetical protein